MVSKTGIGIGNGIPFGNNSSGGDRPYLSPELKSRLRIVAYTYGKRNGDADRATIRNLVDPDNPLICHNFAWIPNSGYGFTTNYVVNSQRGDVEVLGEQHWLVKSVAQEGEGAVRQCINRQALHANFAGYTFNIKCNNIKDTDSVRIYYGYDKILKLKNGDNLVTYETMPSTDNYYVFDFNKEVENIEIEIEPIMQDALVTDGVNDVIESTKTCGEMFADMGNETTISFVSKFHLIGYSTSFNNTTFNSIRNDSSLTARNTLNRSRDVSRKDIIVGWRKSVSNNSVLSYISGILGDKEDYTASSGGASMQDDMKFFPVGYNTSTNTINELSKIAYEWTIGGIGTFTEDDVNQIIAYYNLDRTLKSNIYCNIEKQGITNENHNDFSNQLIDYSGNGRNIQMNNLGWVGGSGIAAKQGESIRDWRKIPDEGRQELTIYNEFKYKVKSNEKLRYWTLQYINSGTTSYPITIIADKDCFWSNLINLYDEEGNKQNQKKEIAIPANTPTQVLCCGFDEFPDVPEGFHPTTAVSYAFLKEVGELTIEFIPSHKGAIILDGINDFGKITGLPINKDYTIAIDYQRLSIGYIENIGTTSPISKSIKAGQGAFLMNLISSTGQQMHTYSFGETSVSLFNDLDRQIYYQSKYKNQGYDITAGTGEDSNSLWLGAVRDSDARFFNGAIYSLIMFPYSMNKFLLDRQLKKYKAGTLYKDMVQLRPVVKADMSIGRYYFNDTSWNVINQLDYFLVGTQFWMILDRVANETIKDIRVSGCKYIRKNYDANLKHWNILLEFTDKSPQKITLYMEEDETLVKFNPVVTTNTEEHGVIEYADANWKTVKPGDWLAIGSLVTILLYKKDIEEVVNATSTDVEIQPNIGWDKIYNHWNIKFNLTNRSPQRINIEIDEYIRFEDIVQPYPMFITFKDSDNNLITWGSKLKVGSTVNRIYAVADPQSNLLNGLYNISGLYLNGEKVNSAVTLIQKEMVFTITATYTKDNNEPTAWLSPRLLRMPNSSYKYLGYIPDISGHGNHGYIKNSAYSGNSGANNYRVDFSKLVWSTGSSLTRISNDYQIKLVNSTTSIGRIGANVQLCTSNLYSYKIKVSGLQTGDTIDYYYSKTAEDTERTIFKITTDGEYILPDSIANNNNLGSIHLSISIAAGNTVEIEEIGLNEGSFALDGVDDSIEFATTGTATGTKQVLFNMIANSPSGQGIILDCRYNDRGFAIFGNSLNDANETIPAYNTKRVEHTYIDGVENQFIVYKDLVNKTHVAICTRDYNSPAAHPIIGCNKSHQFYANMVFWDCVLFPKISTPAMITSHSKYVGIKAKIEIPNWYYDVHGKTNFDTYKTQITEQIGFQKNGTSGDYIANNRNFEYDEMSGYEGYSFKSFNNESRWNVYPGSGESAAIEIISRNGYSITLKKKLDNVYSWQFNYGSIITNLSEDLKLNIKCDKIIRVMWQFKYRLVEGESYRTETISSNDLTPNVEAKLTLACKTPEQLEEMGVIQHYYLIFFGNESIAIDEEYTITMLPLYPNGLVYDGVTDYTEQIKIPVLTDFTLLIKALKLTDYIGSGGIIIKKGINTDFSNAEFIYGLDSAASEENRNSFWSFGGAYRTTEPTPLIGYMTKTSVNGNAITPGANVGTIGLTIAKREGYSKIVFYKTIIYDKTVEQFWIDFLRNMMAREEIIDITYPIFVQGTGGG